MRRGRSLQLAVILTLLVGNVVCRVVPEAKGTPPSSHRLLLLKASPGQDSGSTPDLVGTQKRDPPSTADPFNPGDTWELGPAIPEHRPGLREIVMETVEYFQLHIPAAAVAVVPISILVMCLLCCLTFALDQPQQ